MSWQTYMKEIWTERNERFDTVLSEPPQAFSRSYILTEKCNKKNKTVNIESSEVSEFPTFCKNVLKSGGYGVLLILFSSHREWYESFVAGDFDVLGFPYIISYDEYQLLSCDSVNTSNVGCKMWL